jgi:AbrB family looped-hinge helix DNA binding protein
MHYSTISRRGQTTIPKAVRDALGLKPGDQILYEVQGDHVTLCKRPTALSLKGCLASKKGANLSFAQIRAAARDAWIKRAVKEGRYE